LADDIVEIQQQLQSFAMTCTRGFITSTKLKNICTLTTLNKKYRAFCSLY